MKSEWLIALRLTIALTVLTGLAYPAAVTGAAQALFPKKSHGSLITVKGRVVGSLLVGQDFERPGYFHPRPSAAGDRGYDASASSGSNLGPTSRTLADRVARDAERYARENDYHGLIPADAVTASASGLDPDISPANAMIQVARVASARGVSIGRVQSLVDRWTERPWLGFVGEARVNVLRVNLALDQELSRGSERRSDGEPKR
jgi:potassium-transporting ATPase KdpC subunit